MNPRRPNAETVSVGPGVKGKGGSSGRRMQQSGRVGWAAGVRAGDKQVRKNVQPDRV